ncbi:MAG: hypothetical protein LBP55_00895 [Candidatus Adiutrix sp.]|jgi:hypothetical protein|nr:hypothetical protein [Candidatus Adiutrix sp.]
MATGQAVRGDKLWRSAALIVLCGLVYYFSYDHGRQSIRQEAVRETTNQRQEIFRLQSALLECTRLAAEAAGPPQNPLNLRAGQSRIIFSGRLVVTLLQVENTARRARVQLNFIEAGRLISEELPLGGSLRFSLGGHDWTLVVVSLGLSTAELHLLERQNDL